ncbi:MAG: hypothetical protein IPL53_01350 [Ignavibacteria bacterium]|nr:hypothetical protein [Ignavibacteria bacterium]
MTRTFIVVYLFLFTLILFSSISYSQTKTKINDESFLDKVQELIGIRRTFDVSSETTKPGVLSYKQNDDQAAVFNIDVAVIYKGFRYDSWGFSPSIQFDYSSKPKDQLEKLKGGFDVYYKLYENRKGYAKIEPAVSLESDFYADVSVFQTSLSFIPRYPDFIIPLRNVSDIKFMYDGTDNRWVFGFNPIIGTNFKRTYGDDVSQSDYYASFAGSLSIKRYYMLFELYGRYEEPFEKNTSSLYKYDMAAIFFFDDKERSSLNLRVEQEDFGDNRSRKITIGFGIKL